MLGLEAFRSPWPLTLLPRGCGSGGSGFWHAFWVVGLALTAPLAGSLGHVLTSPPPSEPGFVNIQEPLPT